MKTLNPLFILLLWALAAWSCAPAYDHYTYTETIETKVLTLSLLENSKTSFRENEQRIIDLRNQFDKMINYEARKSKNQITVAMWNRMKSSIESTFLDLWQKQDTMGQFWIKEKKDQFTPGFDYMLDYETKKVKQGASNLALILNQ